MKLLPRVFSSLCLVTLTLASGACATAANRRALYYPARAKGPWQDYQQRVAANQPVGKTLPKAETPVVMPAASGPVITPQPGVVIPPAATPPAATPPGLPTTPDAGAAPAPAATTPAVPDATAPPAAATPAADTPAVPPAAPSL